MSKNTFYYHQSQNPSLILYTAAVFCAVFTTEHLEIVVFGLVSILSSPVHSILLNSIPLRIPFPST